MTKQQPQSALTGRDVQRGSVVFGLIISGGVHMSILIAVIVATILNARDIEAKVEEEMAPFTPVELVALGDPEVDDSLLPKIINPPPKTVKEDVVDPNQKVKKDSIKEKEKPKDAIKKDKTTKRDSILDEFEHDPTRPVTNDKPKGHAEGVPEGTLTNAADKHLMRTWQAKVQARILGRWRVPTTLGTDKLKELAGKTRVRIRISAEGHIVSFNFSRRSGDPQFDSSVERAVKSFMPAFGGGTLPMPSDSRLKDVVIRKGFTLSGWRAMIR